MLIMFGLRGPTPSVTIHSQNRVPYETAPAGNGRDTGKIRHACEAPSFEKCCDTAYPEKSVLILLNLPSNLSNIYAINELGQQITCFDQTTKMLILALVVPLTQLLTSPQIEI